MRSSGWEWQAPGSRRSAPLHALTEVPHEPTACRDREGRSVVHRSRKCQSRARSEVWFWRDTLQMGNIGSRGRCCESVSACGARARQCAFASSSGSAAAKTDHRARALPHGAGRRSWVGSFGLEVESRRERTTGAQARPRTLSLSCPRPGGTRLLLQAIGGHNKQATLRLPTRSTETPPQAKPAPVEEHGVPTNQSHLQAQAWANKLQTGLPEARARRGNLSKSREKPKSSAKCNHVQRPPKPYHVAEPVILDFYFSGKPGQAGAQAAFPAVKSRRAATIQDSPPGHQIQALAISIGHVVQR